ncbi:P-loop containing nucleoside triphosphate hydrolase protein [Lentinula raphanica]|nr:P-loop containing nucleoside triphosphate hydrolase protein [Lentinula raphanica]
MGSPASNHTSFLGKRSRQSEPDSEQLQTPGPTPNAKRAKATTTTPILDSNGNKENVPPLNVTPVNSSSISPPSSRAIRALRRSATVERFHTPAPARASIKRNASFSTSFASLSLTTPPATPLTLLPIHARVRALLRATTDSNVSMPARDNEREFISKLLRGFLNSSGDDASHNLYVSGSPGCGKTALMNSILNTLELDKTRVIKVNCMVLTNLDELWDRLICEFDGVVQKKRKSGTTSANGREAVESLLSGMSTRCILVLDEMDHVASNPQSLSSISNLAKFNKLCVIGIANTHTLMNSPPISSGHFQTLHFSPYTSAQLLQILQSRLSTLTSPTPPRTEAIKAINEFLPRPTLTLLAQKIAGLTGDVRTLFEVLRRAIDLAVTSSVSMNADDDESFFAKAGPVFSVSPSNVLAALKTGPQAQAKSHSSAQSQSAPARTISNSGIVQKVAGLGFQAQLVLLAVLAASKRLEVGLTIDVLSSRTPSALSRRSTLKSLSNDKRIVMNEMNLYAFYSQILRRDGGDVGISTPVSRIEFSDLLGMLEGVGLVVLGHLDTSPKKKRVCLGRSVSFSKSSDASARSGGTKAEKVGLAPGVWADELLRGLGITGSTNARPSQGIKEEELSTIWMREDAVVRKELKNVENKRDAHGENQMFVDASMDD